MNEIWKKCVARTWRMHYKHEWFFNNKNYGSMVGINKLSLFEITWKTVLFEYKLQYKAYS